MTSSSVRTAVELYQLPSRARQLRADPLPHDTLKLLQIAAGEEEAIQLASLESENSRDLILKAAPFFIEQVLLSEAKDSYRILGVPPSATSLELRRNFSLLMRWLHPDGRANEDQTVFASKVTNAWNDLKTPERRADYDAKKAHLALRDLKLDKISTQTHFPSMNSRHSHFQKPSTRRQPVFRKSFIQEFLSFFWVPKNR